MVLAANQFGELVTSQEQYIAFVTEHGICVAPEHAVEMFIDALPEKKVPESRTPEGAGMRLIQYIAACGLCSRRERIGSFWKVLSQDGLTARPGMQVNGDETVQVRGKTLDAPGSHVVVALA